MEQWAGTNKRKFNRDQCKALFLGQVPKFRMRDVGEMPRIFSDSKLKVDQQSDTVLSALHVLIFDSQIFSMARYFSHMSRDSAEVNLD